MRYSRIVGFSYLVSGGGGGGGGGDVRRLQMLNYHQNS
jgi:hypothetical protein